MSVNKFAQIDANMEDPDLLTLITEISTEARLKQLTAAWLRQEATIARLQGQKLPCGHTVRDLEQLESGEVICKGCNHV